MFQYCQLLIFTSLVYVVVLVSILFDYLVSFSFFLFNWYSIDLKYRYMLMSLIVYFRFLRIEL